MNFHLLEVDFPCWAVYLKYQRNSRKHPTKLKILKTYLSTLTNDTVPISITQIYEKVRGPCMAVLYSTDVYMSCTLVSFYELTRFEPLDEALRPACPLWDRKAVLIIGSGYLHDGRVHKMILSIYTTVVYIHDFIYLHDGRVHNVCRLYTRSFCTHKFRLISAEVLCLFLKIFFLQTYSVIVDST